MICKSCGGYIGRDCFNPQECEEISRAMEAQHHAEQYAAPLLQENERLRHENDQLRQELEDTRQHLRSFTSFVATCGRENTQEWMRMLLDWMNGVCQRVEPKSYFVLDGRFFSAAHHEGIEAVQVGEDEGVPIYTEVESRDS